MSVGGTKPANTPFKQQRLPAWQPILTPAWVIGTFLCIGLPFLAIGSVLKGESDSVVEYASPYGQEAQNSDTVNCGDASCEVSFTLGWDMDAPVYVYYQLDNFFQNHRRYVKSRSDSQLLGDVYEKGDAGLSGCDPLETVAMPEGPNQVLSPCGLIANSLFDDVVTLASTSRSGDPVHLDETNIAWKSDVENKFVQPYDVGNAAGFVFAAAAAGAACGEGAACDAAVCDAAGVPEGCKGHVCGNSNYESIEGSPACETGQLMVYYYPNDDTTQYLYESYPAIVSPLVGVKNEHFAVWMRTAALPTFRKLYGRIDTDLKKGDTLNFNVANNVDAAAFSGKKSLVITTTTWIGGRNPFLGIAYMVVGAVCVALGLAFLGKHLSSPRVLGDASHLHWD